jgi:hypothetical protein
MLAGEMSAAREPPAAPDRRAGAGAARPLPAPGEGTSQALKDHITDMALGLLDEQVRARIVHYKSELETNPELDKVTAEVVAGLRELQARVVKAEPKRGGQHREAHVGLLARELERAFPATGLSIFIERRMRVVHRNLARLFFQSELHEKTRGQDGQSKVIQHGEQAIYYLLQRYDHRLKNELGAFDFADDEVRERSFELLARISKEMQDAFLSRRSSELRRIAGIFDGVLRELFTKRLSTAAQAMAVEVVEAARTYEASPYAYKLPAEAFGAFRAAVERAVMVRLVGFAEDALVARLADTAGAARDEALAFVTDPQIFSMICGEICDALYEHLCGEGFLDLPRDYRDLTAPPPSLLPRGA